MWIEYFLFAFLLSKLHVYRGHRFSFDDSHDCHLMSKYSSYPQKVGASTEPLYFYNDLFSTTALTSKMICGGLYGYVRYAELECAELCQGESYAFRLGGFALRLYAYVCDMYD